MQFNSGSVVGSRSFSLRWVLTETNLAILEPNVGLPRPSRAGLTFRHTFELGDATHDAHVSSVLRICTNTKIRTSVIQPVSIDVVHMFTWFCTDN